MAWQNDFQKKTFISFAGYSMNVWLSIYRKCQKDRIFYFRCHRIRNETYSEKFCSWTKPDSAVKQDMKFNCPRRGTITGMRSLFNESSSDRRYDTCLDNTTITTIKNKKKKKKITDLFCKRSLFKRERFA